MSERTATLTFLAKDAASGAVKSIDRAMDGLDNAARKAGGGLKSAGGDIVKLGALAGGAAVAGIGALAGGLALAVKAAAEEEKGVARLSTSLKANIAGFDGNTAAIEKAIKVGEKKAFSDDAQRASLALLVARTKDVAKAQDLMSAAMDLARFKGISLEEASSALIKVEGGQFRALKALGIVVEPVTIAQDKLKASTKNATDAQIAAAKAIDAAATSTAAIAAVQAVAAGQADAYGKTTGGAFESFKIALDDVIENIGGFLLPMGTQLAQMLTNQVIPAAEAIAAKFGEWVAANRPLIDQINTFVSGALADLVTVLFTKIIPAAVDIATKFGEFATKVLTDVGPSVVGFVGQLGELWTTITTKIIPTILDLATRVWEGGLNKAVGAAYTVIGSVITVLGDLVNWITGNETVMEILRSAADLIGTAFGLVADGITGTVDFLGKLGDKIRANTDAMNFLSTVGNLIADGFKAAFGFISDVITSIQTAIGLADELTGKTSGKTVSKAETGAIGNVLSFINPLAGEAFKGITGTRAAGGPVLPGGSYLVGEQGPEILRMGGQGGSIIPNSGGLSMSGVTINVSGAQDPAAIARDILQSLKREVDRQGVSLVPA